ncbi:gp65 [Rhodococcus phage ReqiPine5]|uniref:Gp65 n=1 Tax=Rhodococcus phage ReqiPine5 TaxID=691963 RepID=D4P840_9CAUD|nr:gp65 [Rhodococcus phage ReqiPine5]ADD81170.1 gp65 [Rhodococcus phage ReqiPine5]
MFSSTVTAEIARAARDEAMIARAHVEGFAQAKWALYQADASYASGILAHETAADCADQLVKVEMVRTHGPALDLALANEVTMARWAAYRDGARTMFELAIV